MESLQKLRKRSGNLLNMEAQRLPKGGQGRQKGEQKSLALRQEFVSSPNFWGLGASLSILDTKKTKKSKPTGNWGSNTPLGRRTIN